MNRYDFLNLLMEKLDFPADTITCYRGLMKRLEKHPAFRDSLFAVADDYMTPRAHGLNEHLAAVSRLAEEYGENGYTLAFFFELLCAEPLRKQYAACGLPDALFWDSIADTRAKLLECLETKGVPGSFVVWWMQGLFAMDRFTFGRFQYEHTVYREEDVTLPCGLTVKKGDCLYAMHIPSHGASLTDDVRADSYRRAYEFYAARETQGRPMILLCESWLLHESTRACLPENANVQAFIRDFAVTKTVDTAEFEAWRIYGASSVLPPEEWQEDTSMRRAFKEWIVSGKPTGYGYGFLVLDRGVNVVHIPHYFS